jgi:hypothetical protein
MSGPGTHFDVREITMNRHIRPLFKTGMVGICLVVIGGCVCTQPKAKNISDASQRWRSTGDYYALLELVDTHIDPHWNGKVSKRDVVKCLGEGVHDPQLYPNAGANFWIYSSDRPIPSGSYLFITFGDDGFVKDVSWGSE